MKRCLLFRWNCASASLLFALLVSISVQAADERVRYQAQPGSKMKIEGTSTMHDWAVEGQLIGGSLEVDSQFPAKPEAIKNSPKVEVSIPVRSLKSGKTGMDDVMHTALKQKQHPKIDYRLLEITPKEGAAAAAGAMVFNSKGALTVAGVTKTNAMEVKIEQLPSDKLKITGTTPMKMSDFGIKPPAPAVALGLIKTGDDVKISFEWITSRVKDVPK